MELKLCGKETPYDSIYKLELYPRKAADNVDKILWMLQYTNEVIQDGTVGAGELTFNNMSGRGQPGNTRYS